MSLQHLVPGLDPTGIPGALTKADILAMWTAARAIADEGFVIRAQEAPDVVTYPELQYYLWLELDLDNIPTGDLYYYKTGVWTLLPLVDGSKLGDNTVPLSKLKRTGGNALDLIQINAANNGWQFVSPPNAIAANTLPLNRLVAPDSTYNYLLTCLAGVKAFTLLTDVLGLVPDASIAISKIIKGAANTFLRTNAAGTALEWTTADIADLLGAGYIAGQVPVRNAGNTAWEPYTPPTALVELTNAGSYYTLPTGGTVLVIPHGKSAAPRLINIRLRCTVGNNGYVAGDEIDINAPIGVYASAETTVLYDWAVNAVNILIQCATYSGNLPLQFFQPKAGGDSVSFDNTQWKASVTFIA